MSGAIPQCVSRELELAFVSELCHPPKPWGNTVIYGDTLKQIVVAGSR
jgi:hypothetical protein